jgi:hypothetical protein
MTERFWFIVGVHAPLPLQSPPHIEKVLLAAGLWVTLAVVVPLVTVYIFVHGYDAQALPSMETVPLPLPAGLTVSVNTWLAVPDTVVIAVPPGVAVTLIIALLLPNVVGANWIL